MDSNPGQAHGYRPYRLTSAILFELRRPGGIIPSGYPAGNASDRASRPGSLPPGGCVQITTKTPQAVRGRRHGRSHKQVPRQAPLRSVLSRAPHAAPAKRPHPKTSRSFGAGGGDRPCLEVKGPAAAPHAPKGAWGKAENQKAKDKTPGGIRHDDRHLFPRG